MQAIGNGGDKQRFGAWHQVCQHYRGKGLYQICKPAYLLELKHGGQLPYIVPMPSTHLTFFFENEKPVELLSEGGHMPRWLPRANSPKAGETSSPKAEDASSKAGWEKDSTNRRRRYFSGGGRSLYHSYIGKAPRDWGVPRSALFW
jgi:hypothetical protein